MQKINFCLKAFGNPEVGIG